MCSQLTNHNVILGAFAVESGVSTWFGGISGRAALGGGWVLAGSAFTGVSRPEIAANSLITDISPIVTRSFSAGLTGESVAHGGDRLGIIAHQPLLVSRGRADVRLVSGRDTDRRVQGDTLPVALTPTELSIMELLMRHPGEVMSKAAILESCWDWAYEGDPNIVEVYVRYLRKKIDIPFERRYLETVRGAGYRLVEADG